MRAISFLTLCAALSVLVACGGGKKAENATNNAYSSAGEHMRGAMQNATKPNCGAVQAVWVNLNTKVYHEPNDPAYGNTKHGEYLCPSEARAQGFRPAGGEQTGGAQSGGERSGAGRYHRHKRSASNM